MIDLTSAIFHWISKKFIVIILIILVSTTGIFVYTLYNINFEYDVAKLISPSNKKLAEKFNLISQVGTVEQLIFDLSFKNSDSKLTDSQTIKLIKTAEHFVEKLNKTNDFKSIFYKLEPRQMEKIQKVLYKKRFAIIKPSDLSAKDLYDESFIRKQLERIKIKLSSFEGILTQEYLIKDPLSITERTIKNIMGNNLNYSIKMKRNVLFSEDEKHILVVCKAKVRSFDIDKAEGILNKIQKAMDETISFSNKQIKIKALGGHYYAVSAAKLIKSDLTTIFVLSTLGVILIYLFSFRQVKVLLITFIPIVLGIIWALFALTVFFESIHGITVVFGSTLIGICIDYSTHYFSSYVMSKEQSPDKNFKSITGIKSSLAFGYLTTAVVFLVFYFSGLQFLKEIAVFSVTGISIAFVTSLFIIPQFRFHKVIEPGIFLNKLSSLMDMSQAFTRKYKPFTLISTAIIIVVSVVFISRIDFDKDITKLNYVNPELKSIETEFFKRYGDLSSSNMIAISGKDIESVLKQNDKVYKILSMAKEKEVIDSFFNVHNFLPSKDAQKNNIKHLLSLDWALVQSKVQKVSRELGFKRNAFNGFFNDIKGLENDDKTYVNINDVQNSPLSAFLDEALIENKGGVLLLSYFKSDGKTNLKPLINEIKTLKDVHYINQIHLISTVIDFLKDELLGFIIASFIAIALLLMILYRNFLKSITAITPALLGIITSLGILSALNVSVNIVSVFAIILILGIGLDYGIFMLDSLKKKHDKHTPLAIVVAGLTTILSFGILSVSKNNALSSIGLIILLGILTTMFYSLFLIPILVKEEPKD